MIGNDVTRPPLQQLSAGSTRGTTFFKYHPAHRMPMSDPAALAARRFTRDGAASGSSAGTRTARQPSRDRFGHACQPKPTSSRTDRGLTRTCRSWRTDQSKPMTINTAQLTTRPKEPDQLHSGAKALRSTVRPDSYQRYQIADSARQLMGPTGGRVARISCCFAALWGAITRWRALTSRPLLGVVLTRRRNGPRAVVSGWPPGLRPRWPAAIRCGRPGAPARVQS